MDKIESKKTYIADAGKKGRGVFASQHISSCEVIEIAPILLVEGKLACLLLNGTPLSDYVYDWSYELEDGGMEDAVGIGLGHASLYNTDDDNNPNAIFDIDDDTITVSALRNISPGEEITIVYRDQQEDLETSLVEICISLAEFKLNVKNADGSKKFRKDIMKIQEALHQLSLDHLPKNKEE